MQQEVLHYVTGSIYNPTDLEIEHNSTIDFKDLYKVLFYRLAQGNI